MKKNTQFFGFVCLYLLLLLLLLLRYDDTHETSLHIILWMRAKSSTLGSLLIKLCIYRTLCLPWLSVCQWHNVFIPFSPINIVSFGVNNILFSSSNRNYAQSVLHTHTHTPTLVRLAVRLLLILSFFSFFSYFPFAPLPMWMKQVSVFFSVHHQVLWQFSLSLLIV